VPEGMHQRRGDLAGDGGQGLALLSPGLLAVS
jgi:hypothetical protein